MCRSARKRIPNRRTLRGNESELSENRDGEMNELAGIYRKRGLDAGSGDAVCSQQLMARDALGAHARDELGISTTRRAARPIQAALTSGASFCGRRCRCRLVMAMVMHRSAWWL